MKSLRSKAGRHLSAPQAKRNAEVEDAADEEEVENSTADPEVIILGSLYLIKLNAVLSPLPQES